MAAESTSNARPLPGPIGRIDHVTYVSRLDTESLFQSTWGMLGFREQVRLTTRRFPATHIAYMSGSAPEATWQVMTGLSVSGDPTSPINEFIRRYGEGEQHVAYGVDPAADLDDLRTSLVKQGWTFMTPVLTYTDAATGAGLRQTFVAPTRPYGTFVELVQRLPGRDGQPYGGFDTENIDDLYGHYAEYSAWLERRPSRARRTPPRVGQARS